MATNATLSHNCILSFGSDGSTWTTLANQTTVNLPTPQHDKVEVTDLNETGTVKKYVPSALREPPEITYTSRHDTSSFRMLNDITGLTRYFRLKFETGATDQTTTFQGYATGIPEVKIGNNNDPVELSGKIQATTDFGILN